VTYDLRPFANRLAAEAATLNCLCCGAIDVDYSDTRYVLVELESDGSLAIQREWGLVSTLTCGARICNSCGFVHLHALQPIEKHEGL
jgi:hypothetical protein